MALKEKWPFEYKKISPQQFVFLLAAIFLLFVSQSFTSNISSLVCFRTKHNWFSLQLLANRNLQGSEEEYVLNQQTLVLLSAILFVKNLQGF